MPILGPGWLDFVCFRSHDEPFRGNIIDNSGFGEGHALRPLERRNAIQQAGGFATRDH